MSACKVKAVTRGPQVTVRLGDDVCNARAVAVVQRGACRHSVQRRGGRKHPHPRASFQGSSAPKPQLRPSVCPSTPQDKLSNQSFGTDLPLVDSQVEQHNIFHNEVKAIGPHLAKDKVCLRWSLCGGVGQRGEHTWSNLSPRLCPQEQNSELQAKYQKLLVRRPGRQDGTGGYGLGTDIPL